jgi:phosphate starvation-inducible PhoH-like protein
VQVGVFLRGNELTLDGDPDGVARAQETVQELLLLADRGHALDEDAVEAVVAALDVSRPAPAADGGNGAAEPVVRPAGSLGGDVVWRHRGKQVAAKTATQRRYIDAIRENTVTFGIGPAGTGKTYLAVAMATRALDERLVSRIILTRPAVEAGERLGFLPGDLMAKVDPYLRPLFDALYDMMDAERVAALLERGAVEVAPLAFMRGRTLNDSFVILDEAQNTSPEQMKMFLTRLGFGSKMCVTGDITQIDLARGQASGLVQVQHILSDIPDIQIVRFGAADVVRHHLVQRIVNAYDDFASSHRPPVGDGGE